MESVNHRNIFLALIFVALGTSCSGDSDDEDPMPPTQQAVLLDGELVEEGSEVVLVLENGDRVYEGDIYYPDESEDTQCTVTAIEDDEVVEVDEC